MILHTSYTRENPTNSSNILFLDFLAPYCFVFCFSNTNILFVFQDETLSIIILKKMQQLKAKRFKKILIKINFIKIHHISIPTPRVLPF